MASGFQVRCRGRSQQRVQLGERAFPSAARVRAELPGGERALPQLEPRPAVALVVELEPQVHAQRPGHAGHASGLHLARQQFVLHHVGERRVDRAAHVRGGHHEPQVPAGPRVDLDAVARDRAAGRPEPLRELAGAGERPVHQLARGVENPRPGCRAVAVTPVPSSRRASS